jgi:serralysin
MAGNDVYNVENLVPTTTTVYLTDDGTGIDTITITGTYVLDTDIRLAISSDNGVAIQAVGEFRIGANTYRLYVNGAIENAIGSNGNDYMGGNELGNRLEGDQTEFGVGGNDTISGAEGSDTILGCSGHDQLAGDEGFDWLYGGLGNDTINGGGELDTIEGGLGADDLDGGNDVGDTLSYRSSDAGVNVLLKFGTFAMATGGHAQGDKIDGFTNIWGSDFADKLVGDADKSSQALVNVFSGEGGNDRLLLGGANDRGLGGVGNDTILGEQGNDALIGGAGADSLMGGAGKDRRTGDGGGDRFVFGKASESTLALAGRDTITDFSRGQGDKINLAGIDARSGAGNQAFDFIGTARFTGDKGDLRYVKAGANVLVQGDINGDRKADFAILVEDMASLRAGDFIL